MQTFNKKQIAVAVGAALAAGAAAAAAPTLRTANPALAATVTGQTTLTQTQKQTLFNPATTATGVVGTAFSARLAFNQGTVRFFDSNGTTANLTFVNDSQQSVGAFFVYTTDTASVKIKLGATVAVDSTTVIGDSTATTAAAIGLTLTPPAAGAIRFQAGKLQYTDSTFAAGTWRDIKVDLNADTTNSTTQLRSTIVNDENLDSALDSGDTRIATAINVASIGAGVTLVPTAVAYTRATNGKVDGAKIETFSPLAGFAATNVVVKTRAQAGTAITSDSTADTTFAAAADTTTASTSLYQVSWAAPQSVNWTADTAAADSAAYTAANFNTGIAGAAVPFAFSTDTSVTPALYTSVFLESNGSAAPFASGTPGFPTAGAYLDGVAPVALTSQYDTAASELEIIFSEAIQVNGGTNVTLANKREVVENVSHRAGTTVTTLAAEAFNANATGGASIGFSIGNPVDTSAAAANTRLLLTGVPKAVLDTATAHTIEIGARITIAEPGDGNFSTAAALDAEGGLKAGGSSLADSTALAFNFAGSSVALQTLGGTGVSVSREVLPSIFDSTGNVSAAAFLTSDNTKIQTIVVTFPGTVTVDSTATLTDQFVIELKDSIGTPYADTTGGNAQSFFRFIPTAAQVTGGGTTRLTFTLPTTLEPANAKDTWTIAYRGTNNVLKDANSQAYQAGDVNITLPFTAANTTVGLYTMDAKLPLVGAAPGSRLTTYVARWNDVGTNERFDSTGANSGFTFISSRVTNGPDRVATDILLEPSDQDWDITNNGVLDTLATLMAVERNKVGTTTKPAAIPLYVQLIRNADVAKAANTGAADYLQARAFFSTNPADLDDGSNIGANGSAAVNTPTYVVSLDPVTGNITGRLTGNINIAMRRTVATTGAGLVFLDSNGAFGAFGSAVKSASVLDSASAGRIFIGAERKDNARAFDGAFLLSVLEQQAAGVDTNTLVTSGDPGAKNFFAFTPSLDVRDPNRVGRTTLQAVPLAQLRTAALTNSNAWQLVGIGNLDRALPINERDVPKGFITYAPTGNISLDSIWLGDGNTADMAMTMVGNATALSVEGTTGATRGNLAPKGNAAAFALMDDGGTTDKMSWLLKATSDNTTPTGIGSATGLGLPAGWSLVAVPAGVTSTTNLPANVTMLLKVGAQRGIGGAVSWVTGDPAQTLAQGEPVFVFARAAVAGR